MTEISKKLTDLTEAELKKLGVRKPINITDRGVDLILKMMQEENVNVQGAIYQLNKRFDAFKKANRDRVEDVNRYIRQAFPDGIEGTDRRLFEYKAYEQYMYENGLLKDNDPSTGKEERKGKTLFTFKKLDAELNSLPKSGQNRRSKLGKEIFAIKERGGVPVVVGRDKNGKPIEDPSRSRPYNLGISDEGKKEAKKVSLPVYVQTKMTPQIEMQDRQRKAAARAEANRVKAEEMRVAASEPPAEPLSEKTRRLLTPPEEDKPQFIQLSSDEPEAKKPISEKTKSILGIIKKGGRGAAKAMIPGVGLGLTIVDEVAAAKPLARATFSEIEEDRLLEEAKREELIPEESELRGRTMEEVKSRTSFMNQ
jgi:hypothetical protein|tara:strand:+ start:66 stop:1166 length:1101 start_codon:yes stop_codon:yes gene_type:complete